MKVKLIHEPIRDNYVKTLLGARGIKNIDAFLNPDKEVLQDFLALDNILDGARIFNQIPMGAHIGLIVDSDVDGFTSSAIIYQYLKQFNPSFNIEYFLHDGKQHGFEDQVNKLLDDQWDLIIAPDAASNDKEYIKNFTCPVLIIDHHIVEDKEFLPNMIVINNQISNDYLNKNLSGAGMAYQFCRAMDYEYGNKWADNYIDLAALGVCGDMMSGLETENQYIWKTGFSNIRNYFFLALARKQSYSITGKMNPSDEDIYQALNPTSVAFYIVPLINAMIRVGEAEEKERLFLAFIDGHQLIPSKKRGAKGTLEEVAIESARECTNARAHQNKFKDGAVDCLKERINKDNLLENQILFIKLEDTDTFSSELNGLIATQLSQQFKHPTMIGRLDPEGNIKGSIRGLSNSELTSFKNYLMSTNLVDWVMGHDQAAGFCIPSRNLDRLIEKSNQELSVYNFGETYYEVEFERQAMSNDLVDLIYDISDYKNIWAQQNSEPLIYIKDLHFTKDDIQILGKNNDTLKLMKNGVAYMKFFARDLIQEINEIDGDDIKIEVVGKANINKWMNTITPQIFIEQIEIKKDSLLDF